MEIQLSEPQQDFLSSTSQLNIFMAGQGSGKTHSMAYNVAEIADSFPRMTQFIGANTYSQLNFSTLKRIFSVWKNDLGWERGKHYVVDIIPPDNFMRFVDLKSYTNVISMRNGAVILCGSLENYKAIDGSEFFAAHLDETKDTRAEAVQDVILGRLREVGVWRDIRSGSIYYKHDPEDVRRLSYERKKITKIITQYIKDNPGIDRPQAKKIHKYIQGYNPLFIYTSPASVSWINEMFLFEDHRKNIMSSIFSEDEYFSYKDKDRCIIISSTYHNEHNLPDNFIEDKKTQFAGNQEKVDMLIYGCPFSKRGGEFISTFNRSIHQCKVSYNKDLPIHISLDVNVSPYMTLVLSHIVRDDDNVIWVNVFDCYCMRPPKNNIDDICVRFDTQYSECAGLFYYGDPSARSRNTISKQYSNYYDAIEKNLGKYLVTGSARVNLKAPPVLQSRDLLNKIFSEKFNVKIRIDDSCKELLDDLEFCKEKEDGSMEKKKVKDKKSGLTFEPRGHNLDALRYKLWRMFSDKIVPL